jgi:hypothetical protein
MKRFITLAACFCLIFPATASAQWIACSGGSVTCTTQSVGIGTTTPSGPLDVRAVGLDAYFQTKASTGYARFFVANDTGVGATFYAFGTAFPGTFFPGVPYANLNALIGYGSAFVIGTNSPVPFIFATGPGPVERVRITSSGAMGIGTSSPTQMLDVAGNANFGGTVTGVNIVAKYQDIAEWVAASNEMKPGTVVVLDPQRANAVRESQRAYDPAVAGVVSARPGLTLGEPGGGKEMIASTGRVRVHCDATMSPIRIGDLLVTGAKPGTAIRSEPVLIDGQPFHRPGTIIGKALESLPSGEGEILVLLSLQ